MVINIVPHLISFNMIITGAYARIPEQLFEVGKLEGLTFISEFFRVAVPLVWQTVVVCMISNLAVIFTFDGNIFLYTKGLNETGTMGFYLYWLTYQIAGSADTMKAFYGYPAAIGVTLTVMTIPVVLLGKYVLEKAFPEVEY
jgi:multiple sugar transport system permease protein/N-acetylglucosamine transport system permease protein